MKIVCKYALLLLVISVVSVSAQIDETGWTVKKVKSEVEKGNNRAILNAANTGDAALIPYFKQLASDIKLRYNKNSAAFNAHIALAKLGDAEALKEIIDNVDHADPDIQDKSILKLAYVGSIEAYKKLYELLDDSKPRENINCRSTPETSSGGKAAKNNQGAWQCDVIYFPRNVTVISALLKTVPSPPATSSIPNPETVKLWKEWFIMNGYF